MARYDVYELSNGSLVVDVQADIVDMFKTRVAIPLVLKSSAPEAVRRLHPVFEIEGKQRVLATHLIGTVSTRELKVPVTNLTKFHDQITAALDMVFHGF